MITSATDPNNISLNPLADPNAQRKIADGVLTQLGLHPNQAGARSLLDQHFTMPDNQTQIFSPSSSEAPPLVSSTAGTPAASVEPEKQPATPSTAPITPTMPVPKQPSENPSLDKDQTELRRLIDTGSGIHQIHNRGLRALATVGEIGGELISPGIVAQIPGTDPHHTQLINNQEKLINADLKQGQEEAATQKTAADTAHEEEVTHRLEETPDPINEMQMYFKENPDKKITDYWKDKASASGASSKLTPQEQVMRSLTLPEEEGGMGLTPQDAFSRMQGIIAQNKPMTASAQAQKIQGLLAKAMPEGQAFDPGLMSNPETVSHLLSQTDKLTPEEKSQVYSYLMTKTTPASQGGVARIRSATQMFSRVTPAIDSQTGSLLLVNPEEVQRSPGRYIPATQGTQALTKEAAFSDINYNVGNVESAIHNLKHGFDTSTRAQFLVALRSNDPHKAFNQFISSEAAQNLAPDQVDYLTSLASLNENALALRGLQGLGQGSDELRAAITKLIPGPGTPSEEYALRQMELFKGTVARAQQGIPHTNVKQPDLPGTKTTEEIQNEGHQPSAQAAPAKGTVKHYAGKDWEFQGGDQYDQKNWKEVSKKGAK